MADPVTTVLTGVATSVISSILNNLATLALTKPESSGDFNSIIFKLEAARSYLTTTGRLERHKVREIERVAYCAEEGIEKILWLQKRRRDAGFVGCLLRYNNYHSEYRETISQINKEFEELDKLIPRILESKPSESSSAIDQSEDNWSEDPRKNLDHDDEVFGFDILTETILKELEEGSSNDPKLAVVSIWGMGGIGKSTLASKVFREAENFPIKVSITVSKQYDVLNLRKKILQNIITIDDENLKNMTDKEVIQKLSESIGEKRYLILLDDVWAPDSWDNIFFLDREPHDAFGRRKWMFPDRNNASRIILTTRNLNVAQKPCPNLTTFVHEVEPLDNEEGWKLLKKKAFPLHVPVNDEERWNLLKSHLERFGPNIASKCKGLPLALVVVGGYLSKHLDYKTWEQLAKDVDWTEAGKDIDISKILALSYYDLPDELKPIFLYITAFPEDHIIQSEDLIKLWIAEGFIPPPRGNDRLEKTARTYLSQLYERGLVQVVKWSRAHERISRIRIHDVLRDWGIERGKEDGFFKVISNFDNESPNSFDAHIPYRVALHGWWVDNLGTSMPHLRSLLGFTLPEKEISSPGLNSLRIVSFNQSSDVSERINFHANILNRMKFLRCICFRRCEKISLPSSIGELCNLQTLDCRECTIRSVPSSLWKISSLRHVYLDYLDCWKWHGPNKGLGEHLQALAIYSSTKFSFQEDWNGTVEAVEEMKGIVVLDFQSAVSFLPSNILSKMSALNSLEILKLCEIRKLTRIPSGAFPLSLVKIQLKCCELDEDPMPVFCELPELVVLKLSVNYHLKSMHCSVADGFPRLKHLQIEYFLKLEEWKVDDGALPRLCPVEFEFCDKLKI